jgi:hypothetical protein
MIVGAVVGPVVALDFIGALTMFDADVNFGVVGAAAGAMAGATTVALTNGVPRWRHKPTLRRRATPRILLCPHLSSGTEPTIESSAHIRQFAPFSLPLRLCIDAWTRC